MAAASVQYFPVSFFGVRPSSCFHVANEPTDGNEGRSRVISSIDAKGCSARGVSSPPSASSSPSGSGMARGGEGISLNGWNFVPYKKTFDKHTLDALTTKEYILVRRVRIQLPCKICKFNSYHYLVWVDLEI